MVEDQSIEFQEWHFPDFSEESSITISPEDSIQLIEPLTTDAPSLNLDFPVLHGATEDLSHKAAELEMKEAVLDEKIQYLDSMGLKLSEQFAEAQAVLLKNMVSVIRKAVRKIILKEIDVDQDVLTKMIEAALANVNAKENPCVITVSKADMKQTENNIFLGHVQFKVDELLHQGDFVIENKFFTLEAILEERINRLFVLGAL